MHSYKSPLFLILMHIVGSGLGYSIGPGAKGLTPFGVVQPNPLTCLSGCPTETGILLQTEVTSCDTQPCRLTTQTNYEIAPWFAPLHRTVTLSYSVEFQGSSGTTSLFNASFGETFDPSLVYRVDSQILVPASLSGQNGVVRIHLWDIQRTFVCKCFQVEIR